MNNYSIPINLPFDVKLDLDKFTEQQTLCDKNIINLDLDRWLYDNLDAVILWTEVFYLPRYGFYDIHCDGHELDNKCKLNYIFNSNQSNIIWYEAVDPNKIIKSWSQSQTRYLKLEFSNAKELHRAHLEKFNLVNVGIFHSVMNVDSDRHCLSIVVGDKFSKKRLDFDEVKQRLNKI